MGLAIGFFGRLVDAGEGHGQVESMKKILPIDDCRLMDSIVFHQMTRCSEQDIAHYSSKRRIAATKLPSDCTTLFESFEREAYLAINSGEANENHIAELRRLLGEKLQHFSWYKPCKIVRPRGYRGKIMLALALVADAAITSSKEEAFAKLSAAQEALPSKKVSDSPFLATVQSTESDNEAQNTNLSVRSIAPERKKLSRGKNLGVSSSKPCWSGNPFER